MNDFQATIAASAATIRARLEASTHRAGFILSVYHRRETFRPVRLDTNDMIEVLVGSTWRAAYLSLEKLQALVVQ